MFPFSHCSHITLYIEPDSIIYASQILFIVNCSSLLLIFLLTLISPIISNFNHIFLECFSISVEHNSLYHVVLQKLPASMSTLSIFSYEQLPVFPGTCKLLFLCTFRFYLKLFFISSVKAHLFFVYNRTFPSSFSKKNYLELQQPFLSEARYAGIFYICHMFLRVYNIFILFYERSIFI